MQVLAALGQGLLPVYQILVARLFGVHAQGVYGTAVSYLEVLGRTGIAGSDRGLMRYVAAHSADGSPDKVAQALAAALRLSLTTAVVLMVALLLAADGIARLTGFAEATVTLRAMSPTLPAFVLVLVLVSATLGARTSRVHLAVRGIAEPALLTAGALVAYALGAGLAGLAIAHSVAFIGAALLAALGARWVLGTRVVAQAIRGPSLPGFKRFAVPLGVSEMTTAILQRADVIILGVFVDATTVGVYFAAEQLSRSVTGVRYAFDGVAAPLLAEALHQQNRARLQYNLTLLTRWIALAAAPACALAFTLRPELLALFSPEHRVAATAMGVLLLAQLFNSIVGLTPVVLVMSGRSGLYMWATVGAAITSVTLNLILVPRFGIVGAATATACASIGLQLTLTIQTWILQRVHPLSWDLAKALLAGGVVWLYGSLVRTFLVLPAGVTVALVVGGGAILYAVTLLGLGLAPEERALAWKLWRRLPGGAGRTES